MAAADAARNERRFKIGMVTGVEERARAASTNPSGRANRAGAPTGGALLLVSAHAAA